MNKTPRILFADKPHPKLTEQLLDAGIHCDFFPEHDRQQVEAIIHQYNGLIIRSRFSIDQAFLDISKHLVCIGREGAGMDNIDVAYAESIGIACLNSPEGNRDAVGEHTLGMLLALFNKICLASQSVQQGMWERELHRGLEIKGKTIAIIGYGNMGSAFAKRLKGFDAHVIAYDKYKTGYTSSLVTEVTLSEVYEMADIVSIHVPLTEETKNMANSTFFNSFKKSIYIINTARGKVLCSADLVNAMKDRKVLGAALDVLDYESPSQQFMFDPTDEVLQFLLTSQNVLITPHVAGWTIESKEKLSLFLGQKIIDLFKQKKLL